jgi:hypothetical protein
VPRLAWNSSGTRSYEAGVDRGVLYVAGQPGVAWNGLTSVSENSSGGEAKPYYIDGVKYANVPTYEEYEATITAFTYPDEFLECEGRVQARSGLFVTRQRRKSFGFSYRTKVGNDLADNLGYKIHIIYNALASPSDRESTTVGDSVEAMDFSWDITTRPPAISGYRRTSHFVIDSRHTDPIVLGIIEDILYGNESETARLPTFDELLEAFDTISNLVITDNGDGTWTATAPFDVIQMLDETTFQITSPMAIFIDEDSYTISSE